MYYSATSSTSIAGIISWIKIIMVKHIYYRSNNVWSGKTKITAIFWAKCWTIQYIASTTGSSEVYSETFIKNVWQVSNKLASLDMSLASHITLLLHCMAMWVTSLVLDMLFMHYFICLNRRSNKPTIVILKFSG